MKIHRKPLLYLVVLILLGSGKLPVDIINQFGLPEIGSVERINQFLPEIKIDLSLMSKGNMKIDGVRAYIPIREIPNQKVFDVLNHENISFNMEENPDKAYPILGIFKGF